MTSHKADFKEQRVFQRFPADDSSAVMLSSANVISYSVLNVSKTGLAFCYHGSIEKSLVKPVTTITLLSNDFGATELPVQVISDAELTTKDLLTSENKVAVKKRYLRKCGVKFLPMSEGQEKAVDEYLHNCCLTKEM